MRIAEMLPITAAGVALITPGEHPRYIGASDPSALLLQQRQRAVFTFPLRNGDHQLGALDLYRDTPGVLSSRALSTSQTLAEVATAYLVNARAREELKDPRNDPVNWPCTMRSPDCPTGR
jgi:GAF domain-containing protein